MTATKTLVAYFSASGETARLARTLADVTGADLHEIVPAEPYTAADLDWNDRASRSSVEMNDPASRPAVSSRVEDMDAYDTVFVGFPIWWYVAPTIVSTFLEAYDFAGETGDSLRHVGRKRHGAHRRRAQGVLRAPRPRWLPGKRLASRASEAEVRAWVESLGL